MQNIVLPVEQHSRAGPKRETNRQPFRDRAPGILAAKIENHFVARSQRESRSQSLNHPAILQLDDLVRDEIRPVYKPKEQQCKQGANDE